jgi:hypothetical protein
MKTFTEWRLTEAREDLIAWLAPHGKFYPIIQPDTHQSWAVRFFKDKNAVENIYKKGWVRVYYYSKTIYASNADNPPNARQRKELIDLALENGFNEVIWDSEENEKVIWSREDRL